MMVVSSLTKVYNYHCKEGAEVGCAKVTSENINTTTCYCAADNCNPMDEKKGKW